MVNELAVPKGKVPIKTKASNVNLKLTSLLYINLMLVLSAEKLHNLSLALDGEAAVQPRKALLRLNNLSPCAKTEQRPGEAN